MGGRKPHPIHVPPFSSELAEETGIHIGDGCLISRKHNRSYAYEIATHSIDDDEYRTYITEKLKSLYGLNTTIRDCPGRKAKTISCYSKLLLIFKLEMGLPLGPKDDIQIPVWVFSSDEFIKACVRGIVDTDGSLAFKRRYGKFHYYPVISFVSQSRLLANQVYTIFTKFNIRSSLYLREDERNGTPTRVWVVQISGVEKLEKYLEIFGFSNRKHLTKLQVWKKFGFCPSQTTTPQRELILEGKLDPYVFYNAPGEI